MQFNSIGKLCETSIDGVRMSYDGCTKSPFEEAVKFYKPDEWVYLGQSKVTFHNGVKNEWDEVFLFFNRKKY